MCFTLSHRSEGCLSLIPEWRPSLRKDSDTQAVLWIGHLFLNLVFLSELQQTHESYHQWIFQEKLYIYEKQIEA